MKTRSLLAGLILAGLSLSPEAVTAQSTPPELPAEMAPLQALLRSGAPRLVEDLNANDVTRLGADIAGSVERVTATCSEAVCEIWWELGSHEAAEQLVQDLVTHRPWSQEFGVAVVGSDETGVIAYVAVGETLYPRREGWNTVEPQDEAVESGGEQKSDDGIEKSAAPKLQVHSGAFCQECGDDGGDPGWLRHYVYGTENADATYLLDVACPVQHDYTSATTDDLRVDVWVRDLHHSLAVSCWAVFSATGGSYYLSGVDSTSGAGYSSTPQELQVSHTSSNTVGEGLYHVECAIPDVWSTDESSILSYRVVYTGV